MNSSSLLFSSTFDTKDMEDLFKFKPAENKVKIDEEKLEQMRALQKVTNSTVKRRRLSVL